MLMYLYSDCFYLRTEKKINEFEIWYQERGSLRPDLCLFGLDSLRTSPVTPVGVDGTYVHCTLHGKTTVLKEFCFTTSSVLRVE